MWLIKIVYNDRYLSTCEQTKANKRLLLVKSSVTKSSQSMPQINLLVLQYGGGIALRCPIKNPRLPFPVSITIIIPWLILKGNISRGSITILFVVQCKETLPLTLLREGLNTVPEDLCFCIHHIVGCVHVQREYEMLSSRAVHWPLSPRQQTADLLLGQLDCHSVAPHHFPVYKTRLNRC